MACEIVQRNGEVAGIALVGICTRGAVFAHRLQQLKGELEADILPFGVVDITLSSRRCIRRPTDGGIGPTELPFEISETRVVLIDDALYTRRTIRAGTTHSSG